MRYFYFVLCLVLCFFSNESYAFDEYAYPRTMENFSGLSVQEILSKRENAVKNSKYFGDLKNYKPSHNVFQIEDHLPWISAHEISCYGLESTDISRGPSRESVGILNPELLYYVNISTIGIRVNNNVCSSVDYFIPDYITLDKSAKQIIAHINYSAFFNKNHAHNWIILSDSNARDFGYNYAYADLTSNLHFQDKNNIASQIMTTRGFYHRGGACKLPSGCNNYSPYNSGIVFYLKSIPAILRIKLWKSHPTNLSDPADITYIMKFE